MIGSYILWHHNRPLGGFYFTVVQMQLIEYILWTQQDTHHTGSTCTPINKAATAGGIVINHLEPLVLYALILMYSPITLPWPVHVTAVLYTLMSIKYTLKALRHNLCTSVTPQSCPHLEWQWNYNDSHSLYYALFLLFAVITSLYGLEHPLGTVHAFILISTFAVSKMIYGSKKATGALWCFFAAFVPYVLYFTMFHNL